MGDAEGENTVVGDVRRILYTMRRQYDDIHVECQRAEEEFQRTRELIRQLDTSYRLKQEQKAEVEHENSELTEHLDLTGKMMESAKIDGKVYAHMLERARKEQSVLRQKVLSKETELGYLKASLRDRQRSLEKAEQMRVEAQANLEQMEKSWQAEEERHLLQLEELELAIAAKKAAVERRKNFDTWRKGVAQQAAADAFHASAGRLQKAYALEKMVAASIAQHMYSQLKQAEPVEEVFNRIKAATGGSHDTSAKKSPSPSPPPRTSTATHATGVTNGTLANKTSPQSGTATAAAKSPSRTVRANPAALVRLFFSPRANQTSPAARHSSPAQKQKQIQKQRQSTKSNSQTGEVVRIVDLYASREQCQAAVQASVAEIEAFVKERRTKFEEMRNDLRGVGGESTQSRDLFEAVERHNNMFEELQARAQAASARAHAACVQVDQVRQWVSQVHAFFVKAGWETENPLLTDIHAVDRSAEATEKVNAAVVTYIRETLPQSLQRLAQESQEAKNLVQEAKQLGINPEDPTSPKKYVSPSRRAVEASQDTIPSDFNDVPLQNMLQQNAFKVTVPRAGPMNVQDVDNVNGTAALQVNGNVNTIRSTKHGWTEEDQPNQHEEPTTNGAGVENYFRNERHQNKKRSNEELARWKKLEAENEQKRLNAQLNSAKK